MAITDFMTNFNLLIRWLHVIAGIVWIGHLYFFNFVNGPVQGKLDGPTKKIVNPQLMPRALWWFRWGAMTTFIMGLLLFTIIYMYKGDGEFGPSVYFWDPSTHEVTQRAWWILLGMLFGFIMWFNVWFVIWPAQKKIQAAVRDGVPPDAALVKRATMASKVNTYLSGPMLFGMLAPNHYGSINIPTAIVAIALGAFAIWWAYRTAPRAAAGFATEGKALPPAAADPTKK